MKVNIERERELGLEKCTEQLVSKENLSLYDINCLWGGENTFCCPNLKLGFFH